MAAGHSTEFNRTLLLAGLVLGFSPGLMAQSHTVEVPPAAVSTLVAVLEEAAARPPTDSTEIIINGTYIFDYPQRVPPAIQSQVTIRGGVHGAVLTAQEGGVGTLFRVEEGASLRLANIEISGFELNGALIANHGVLDIERVQFLDNQGFYYCHRGGCQGGGSVIYNDEGATARLDQVSIIDSGTPHSSTFPFFGSVVRNRGQAEISNLQLYFSGFGYNFAFDNGGSLRLTNSTILARNTGEPALFTDAAGESRMENSIVSGFNAEWCSQVVSLGFNLVDSPDCVFGANGDLVGVQPDLVYVPVSADWNPGGREILAKALVPLAESVAVDSGSPDACSAGGLVSSNRTSNDGDGDGLGGCDRGAVERIPSTVDMGGVNGLFYNPLADGHYLYIAETTFPTMVMWTTFDSEGQPAWVFGLGDRVSAGGRLVADAWINRGGSVLPDGSLTPANSQPWGTMEVQMNSCNRGRLTYQSDQPGFGSGTFEFERLAFVDQVGCVD